MSAETTVPLSRACRMTSHPRGPDARIVADAASLRPNSSDPRDTLTGDASAADPHRLRDRRRGPDAGAIALCDQVLVPARLFRCDVLDVLGDFPVRTTVAERADLRDAVALGFFGPTQSKSHVHERLTAQIEVEIQRTSVRS